MKENYMSKGKEIPKQKKKKSLVKGISSSNTAKQSEQESNNFVLSLKYLDVTQGQTLCEWENDGILAQAIDVLKNYCCTSLVKQNDKKFTIYGGFPPKNKTDFYFPKHIPIDAEWARIKINGTQSVVGHIDRNIFNIVFLDKQHRFWISEKNIHRSENRKII